MISWYSKGAIFKRPTVLGGIGVGDKHNGIGSGAEAILPINQLPKLLGLDKMQENNNTPIVVNTILDGKTIAQTIAQYSDVVSGNRMNLAERGLALYPLTTPLESLLEAFITLLSLSSRPNIKP